MGRPRALVQLAQRLNAAGWRAFPTSGPPAKKPLITGYHGELPFGQMQVERMPWSGAGGVGVALLGGFMALDIDVKDGARGKYVLDELQGRYGPLPATRRQETPSGGWHLLFDMGSFPPHSAFASHVGVPHGEMSNIDIIHPRNRYLGVYSRDFFLDSSVPIAAFPEAWWPLVSLPTHEHGTPARRASMVVAGDVAEALAQVATAAVGSRNNTLNAVAFELGLNRRLDASTVTALVDAAVESGQSRSEAQATVESAADGARRARREADRWLEVVFRSTTIQASRRRARLEQVATVLADLKATVAPTSVDLGVRSLAAEIGVTRQTAAVCLTSLVEAGFLERSRWEHPRWADSYSLLTPSASNSNSDTHPSIPPPAPSIYIGTTSQIEGVGSEELLERRWMVGDLLRHDAFRPGPGPRLTDSSAEILVSVRDEALTLFEITMTSGLHATTVKRTVDRLVAETILETDGQGTYWLRARDPETALDHWARTQEVRDRATAQRAGFDAELKQYLRDVDRNLEWRARSGLRPQPGSKYIKYDNWLSTARPVTKR